MTSGIRGTVLCSRVLQSRDNVGFDILALSRIGLDCKTYTCILYLIGALMDLYIVVRCQCRGSQTKQYLQS